MFSDWSRCTASSPFATCTSRIAPAFFAASSTSCLSRCQRSSLSVSIEKPMRTGPLADAAGVCADPLVLVVLSCGALMHDASRTALRNRGQIFFMRQLLPQRIAGSRVEDRRSRACPRSPTKSQSFLQASDGLKPAPHGTKNFATRQESRTTNRESRDMLGSRPVWDGLQPVHL